MDIATLGIKVENGDVIKATTSLNEMTVAGGKSEAATQRLTRRMALLEIEARNMDAQLGRGRLSLAGLATSMGLSEEATSRLSKAIGALSAIAVVGFIGRETIKNTEEAQNAMAQLEAAVKSTGGVAGRSVQQLDDLSMAMQRTTTYSDEAVKGAESLLLTFDKIRGTEFDRATQAVADLATRMGGDLQGAAIQVGKALQDPEHGLTALRRAGVSFSASQIEVIKDLYETGHAAEGQRVILKELEHQFGGSAAAARDTLGGALSGLKNAFGDLFEVTRGASQGTVSGINAITKALENSGLSMSTVLKDAAVDWETMRASIEKVHAIMSLQIGPGFLAQAKAIMQRIDFDLNAKIAELNAPAKTAPASAPKPQTVEITEEMRKFAALKSAREEELGKLTALNGAYGQSDLALKIIALRYDAMIAKSKDATEHHGRELAILNRLTDGILKQSIAQAKLADQQARSDQLRATERSNTEVVRSAQQELELTTLAAQQASHLGLVTSDVAARRRIDLAQENALLAAQLDLGEKTLRATAEQAVTAQAEYDSTVKRVTATHDLALANQGVVEVMARIHQVAQTSSDLIFEALDGLGRKGANIFQSMWDSARRGLNQFLANIAGAKIGEKFAELMGIGPNVAATKQVAAGATMLTAATMQLQAATLMATGRSIGSTAGGIVIDDAGGSGGASRFGTAAGYGSIVAGAGLTGYGVGSSLYSTSHGAAGNYARGALGGAAGGALAGAAIGSVIPGIGTAVGAVVGAVTGFIGGILGIGSAAKEAAKQTAELRTALSLTMAGLRAEVGKDALASSIAQVEAQREQIRKQIEDAYSGGGANSDTVRERTRQMKELNALEDERIRQLKEEAAVVVQRQVEDYNVRTLRAQGKTKEADDAAFDAQQRREREDLIRSFGSEIDATEAATLAALDQALAAEKLQHNTDAAADALGKLTSALRNAPSGFFIEKYLSDFAVRSPRIPPPRDTRPSIPLTPSTRPTFSATGTAAATFNFSGAVFTFPDAKDGKATAKAFLAALDETRRTTVGPNGTRAAALERMTS